MLDKLNCFSDNEENNIVFNCIHHTVESMANFTSKENTSIIWKCFYVSIFFLFISNSSFLIFIIEFLKDKIYVWKEEPKKLYYLTQLMVVFLNRDDCYLIDNLDLLLEVFKF